MNRFLMLFCLLLSVSWMSIHSETKTEAKHSLKELQQQFVDLKFSMFIHFNMATYVESD